MRKKSWILLLGFLLVASVAMAASYKVIVQEGMIRMDKRFFAPVVVRVPFGATVESVQREGDWVRVKYQGKEGWMHVSAIQEQKFQMSSLARSRAQETTQEEVALAGKGFTPEVEKAFRQKNPQMKYDLVDQIQSYKIADEQIAAFIKGGDLKEPGGGS